MPMAPRRSRRPALAALLLSPLALTVLVSCSGSKTREAAPSGEPKGSATPAGRVETFTLDAADYGVISANLPEAPVATAPSAVEGIQIEVYSLSRTDESVTLILALHNTKTSPAGFESSEYYAEQAGNFSVSGISLFDPKGFKQYLTFRQPGTDPSDPTKLGRCLCSSSTGLSAIPPGQRAYLAAIFPAPPPDVTKLTVQAGFGAVADVPVSRG